jgi:hypothetical protein
MEKVDLAIIGAGKPHYSKSIRYGYLTNFPGIHGLAVLKTYLDIHPDASIVVLDKESSLGGVWAEARLYPGLRTNNHFQTYVFWLIALHNTDVLQI